MSKNNNQIYFEKELSILSGRARNFLYDLKISNYNLFYKKIIKNQKVINFRTIRNCGEKTTSELVEFSRKIISFTERENDSKVFNNLLS